MPVLGSPTFLTGSPSYGNSPYWNGTAWVPRQASRGIKNSVTPEAFGAVGNTPATDDAPAIEAAIASAVAACIADGSYVCEVVFDAGKNYYANRAPVVNPTINGTPAYSNAQIALPYLAWGWQAPNATPIVTVILRSQSTALAENTTFSQQPSSIISTPTTGHRPTAAPLGIVSVIGGPASGNTTARPKQWSGINLVIDGLNIVCPPNPVLCALDLAEINTVTIESAHIYVVTNGYAAPATCTNQNAFGVRFPANQNGGNIKVGQLGVYGFYCGFSMPEHLRADNIQLYWNTLAISYDQVADHESIINLLQTTGSLNAIGCISVNGGGIVQIPSVVNFPPTIVNLWGTEDIDAKIWDLNNNLKFEANLYGVIGPNPKKVPPMDGGAHVRINSLNQSRGSVTAPTLPATTVAHRNIFGRDAWVTVAGGTVTGIAVDGVPTGLTSGQVIVPNGRTITLTYSSAPTWAWWLF